MKIFGINFVLVNASKGEVKLEFKVLGEYLPYSDINNRYTPECALVELVQENVFRYFPKSPTKDINRYIFQQFTLYKYDSLNNNNIIIQGKQDDMYYCYIDLPGYSNLRRVEKTSLVDSIGSILEYNVNTISAFKNCHFINWEDFRNEYRLHQRENESVQSI